MSALDYPKASNSSIMPIFSSPSLCSLSFLMIISYVIPGSPHKCGVRKPIFALKISTEIIVIHTNQRHTREKMI